MTIKTAIWCKICQGSYPAEVIESLGNYYDKDDTAIHYRVRRRQCSNCRVPFRTYEVNSELFQRIRHWNVKRAQVAEAVNQISEQIDNLSVQLNKLIFQFDLKIDISDDESSDTADERKQDDDEL